MIVRTFDQGWNPHIPLKIMEQEILKQILFQYQDNDTRAVIINNTWYTDDFHQLVMRELQEITPDIIFLVSMLDPPIVQPSVFLPTKTTGIGYHHGPGEFDFWALAVEKNMILHEITHDPDLPFMCLNRKPHEHRVQLYERLSRSGLLDLGLISLGGNDGQAQKFLSDDQGGSDMAPNGGVEQNGIPNDIFSLGNPVNWNRCLINIVTETVYDISRANFVSEKIYKPIIGERPFLVYAPGGAKHWLESRGFETYLDDWRDITDLDLSQPENIVEFLCRLCEQPRSYLRKKIIDLRSKILYNKNRFYTYCTEQQTIVKKGLPCPV